MKIHTKIRQTLSAALAAMLVLANALPVTAEEISGISPNLSMETAAIGEFANEPDSPAAADGDTADIPEDRALTDEHAPDDAIISGEQSSDVPDDAAASDAQEPGVPDDVTENDGQTPDVQEELVPDGQPEPDMPDGAAWGDEQTPDESKDMSSDDIQIPVEPPAFSARVEISGGGYVVRGTFTELIPGIVHAQPMYSLDGCLYLPCGNWWDLDFICSLGDDEAYALSLLGNHICLYASTEPFSSYLAGELDRFYLKLCITLESGESYETQAAVIDRSSPQPLPEGVSASVMFESSVRVVERNPVRCCGRYQITVSEDATPEEIAACLPDTIPVQVSLMRGINAFTECVVDCPVTWNPLSLHALTPGESVTIADAAREIFVPDGTLLHTPLGIFQLEEAARFDQYASDEINLVLNVVARDETPSAALWVSADGLELSFHLKPTGATKIRAYVCTEGDTQWSPLPDLPFLDAINAQPSTAYSDYTLLLDNNAELVKTYLAQRLNPDLKPFYVGLDIEGGVYDGRQLILAWPDDYTPPKSLPKLVGSGGNENNAGSDNKSDSTDTGQRPNLPGNPSESPAVQPSASGSVTQTESQTPNTSEPEQPGGQANGTPNPGQPGGQAPGTPKPGQPAPQTPGKTKPDQPDPKSPDKPKPGQSDPKSPVKNSASKDTAAGAKTDATGNSAASIKTNAPKNLAGDTKTGITKSFTADEETGAPTARTSAHNKKTGDVHTPALPDPMSDDLLYNKEDTSPAQSDRTETDAPSIQSDRSKLPDRSKGTGERRSPLPPMAAATALFGTCITAARGRARKR